MGSAAVLREGIGRPGGPLSRVRILACGLDRAHDEGEWSAFEVVYASSSADVFRLFDEREPTVLLLGPRLKAEEQCAILTRISNSSPGSQAVNVVIGVGAGADLFQGFIDEDRLFYLTCGHLTNQQLHDVVTAAVRYPAARAALDNDILVRRTDLADSMLDFMNRILPQTDLASVAGLLEEAVQAHVSAATARCWMYDREKQTLIYSGRIGSEEAESTAAGLLGFVARTGKRVVVERAELDARSDPEADGTTGGSSRFLGEPILAPGIGLIGVVTAVRDDKAPPFTADDADVVEGLASCAAVMLSQIRLQSRLQDIVLDRTRGSLSSTEVFRQEALEENTNGWDHEGDVLRTNPAWLKLTHWISVLLLLAGLGFMSLARVHDYARGPSIIRARRKIEVLAPSASVVQWVGASAGDRVHRGEVLARLEDLPRFAPAPLKTFELTAPADGLVGAFRVRAGQMVSPGEPLASVIDESQGYDLITLAPGMYGPQIHAGMPLVLRLEGYPASQQVLAVDNIGAEVIGPREASRDTADMLAVNGPVVVLRSRLGTRAFSDGSRQYFYRDGMTGQSEMSLSSTPIVFNLVPGLKTFFHH